MIRFYWLYAKNLEVSTIRPELTSGENSRCVNPFIAFIIVGSSVQAEGVSQKPYKELFG